ncbi:MAG: Fe-S protein assembly co-chaperone HscB [Lautropia sp.]|nr:Fe-S protein assembly co-chaperone HscB [Lautropia sp.]
MTEGASGAALQRSWFELLGMPERFALDLAELETRHHRFQAVVHPDRHVSGTAHDRRLALQLAAQGNEAFRVLSEPLSRAAYLCERHGAPVDAERNTAMPPAFLMKQMSWHEDIDEARDATDVSAAQVLQQKLSTEREQLIAQLGVLIDEQANYAEAVHVVRQLMFFNRLQGSLTEVIRQKSA